MSVFNDLQKGLVKHLINGIKVSPERAFYNIDSIKTIHVLYYLHEPVNIEAKQKYQQLSAILEDLKKHGIRANLTYFADNTMMESARMNVTPLSYSDFNKWTLKPNAATYDSFMYDDPDVLLNLSPITCWQLEYLVQYSKASFKIGVQREEQGARYDFLFKPEESTTFPLGVYEQIVKYLQIINK